MESHLAPAPFLASRHGGSTEREGAPEKVDFEEEGGGQEEHCRRARHHEEAGRRHHPWGADGVRPPGGRGVRQGHVPK